VFLQENKMNLVMRMLKLLNGFNLNLFILNLNFNKCRVKDAGAILLAITNVPELALWWESSNKLYGRSNNPYDVRRTPGGSSGGEGALIAAAGSVIGLGNDVGGSLRVPAVFCGIFGLKPGPGF